LGGTVVGRIVVTGQSRICASPGRVEALLEQAKPSNALVLSVLLAVLALMVRYAHLAIPIVSAHSFQTLLIGFLLLLAGNLFRGF
jgi:hypothetical protein